MNKMCIRCRNCNLRQVCDKWLHGKGHDYQKQVTKCFACGGETC